MGYRVIFICIIDSDNTFIRELWTSNGYLFLFEALFEDILCNPTIVHAVISNCVTLKYEATIKVVKGNIVEIDW